MTKKRYIMLAGTLLFMGFMAPAAFGAPSLGDILSNPAYAGYNASPGAAYVTLDTGDSESVASILLESAGFAPTNRFGIFDPTNGNKLELFAGPDSPGSSQTVYFDLGTGQAWTDPASKVSFGTTFGFYLDSSARARGGLFYSDPSWNTGGDAGKTKALLFDTAGAGLPGNPDVTVAFEDLKYRHSDGDYNDMVVGITNTGIAVVPAPGSILVASLGTLLVGWLKKKQTIH